MRVLLLLCAALSGCGGVAGFYKPGAEYRDFYADLRGCEAETSPASSWCFGQMCQQQAAQQNKRRNQCMMARGWEITRKEPKFVP